MKVSDLVVGNLYRPKSKTISSWKNNTKTYDGFDGKPLFSIETIKILHVWSADSYGIRRKKLEKENLPFLFLGTTIDNWYLPGGIYKHHWFLYDGEKIIIPKT